MSCRSSHPANAFDERTPGRIFAALVALAWLVAATSLASPLRAQESTDDDESLRPGALLGVAGMSERCRSACGGATFNGLLAALTVGREGGGMHGDLTGMLWGRPCVLSDLCRSLSVIVAGVRFTPPSHPSLGVRGGVGGYRYERGYRSERSADVRAYGPAARLAVWYRLPSPYVEAYWLVAEWVDGLGGVARSPATSLDGAPIGEAFRPRVIAIGFAIE